MSVCGQFFQLKKNENAETSRCKNTRNGPRLRCCMLFCFNFCVSVVILSGDSREGSSDSFFLSLF
jgi:hypothetical protein